MNKGKGKVDEQGLHGQQQVVVGESRDVEGGTDCDHKSSTVMITSRKRTRSVSTQLDPDYVDDNGNGLFRGRTGCTYKKRSMVWNHMTKLPCKENELEQASCNYCMKIFPANTFKNGTGHMKYHLEHKCPKAPEHVKKSDPLQKLIGNSIAGIASVSYSAEASRLALAEMVIVDEMPFKLVEAEGFRKFCSSLQAKFLMPSRQTIHRDCMKIYKQQKSELKKELKGVRLCLTTDTWTSIQNVNYMSLTGHYVDSDWVYKKKILNFVIVESHKGEALGKCVERCLIDWGISSIFTVTVDNASANNLLIGHLVKRTKSWTDIVCDHDFIHVRCAAHVLNLVVSDGLKEENDSIEKIRNAVRFVRSSPARLALFNRAAQQQGVLSSQLLCLDVPTRWNSTYLMLAAAIRYKKVFEFLGDDEVSYDMYFDEDDDCVSDVSKKGRSNRLGPPQSYDFEVASNLVKFLKVFYDSTLRLSTSSNVTASSCFGEIAEIHKVLNQNINNEDSRLSSMSKSMKVKFDKYWGNLTSTNLLLYIAVVLDPRLKMNYLKFCFKRLMTDEIAANKLLNMVYEALSKMYNWFVANADSSAGKEVNGVSTHSIATESTSSAYVTLDSLEAEFKQQMRFENLYEGRKSELEQYLSDACMFEVDHFDILFWWKNNCGRYPVVSQMAKLVMAVPMSTVASESCFSTGGRILDAFRSSLAPETVEALICTQNWLRAASVNSVNAVPAASTINEVSNDYIAPIEDLGADIAKVNTE